MAEDGKSVVRKVLEEVWDKGNYDAVDEYFASDFVDHTPGMTGPDREGQKSAARRMRDAFPDLHTEYSDLLVEGDRVLLHYHGVGTHQGDFLGMSPTGKKVCMGGMSMYRIEGGKLKEHWGYFDTMNLMDQLGAFRSFDEQSGFSGGSSGEFSGGRPGFEAAVKRAGSHHETTVRSGQTDLYGSSSESESRH
jgi:predicted ester cyclase